MISALVCDLRAGDNSNGSSALHAYFPHSDEQIHRHQCPDGSSIIAHPMGMHDSGTVVAAEHNGDRSDGVYSLRLLLNCETLLISREDEELWCGKNWTAFY